MAVLPLNPVTPARQRRMMAATLNLQKFYKMFYFQILLYGLAINGTCSHQMAVYSAAEVRCIKRLDTLVCFVCICW
jgi:hypothetical protein